MTKVRQHPKTNKNPHSTIDLQAHPNAKPLGRACTTSQNIIKLNISTPHQSPPQP